jgi:hypothetical protein
VNEVLEQKRIAVEDPGDDYDCKVSVDSLEELEKEMEDEDRDNGEDK